MLSKSSGGNLSEKRPNGGHTGKGLEEEISLIDLWLLIVRRKWQMVAIFLLCLLGGLGYWLMQVPRQQFVTTIEVGHYMGEKGINDIHELENRDYLATRLRETVWPVLRKELAESLNVPQASLPELQISVPKKETPGAFIYLQSQAAEKDADYVRDIHQSLAQTVIEQHAVLLQPHQEKMDAAIEDKKLDLKALQADSVFYKQTLTHELAEAQADIQKLKAEVATDQMQLRYDLARAKERLQEITDTEKKRRQSLADELAITLAARDKAVKAREQLDALMKQVDARQLFLEERFAQLQEGMLQPGGLTPDLQKELARVREELTLGIARLRLDILAQVKDHDLAMDATLREVLEKETALSQFDGENKRLVADLERLVAQQQIALDQFAEERKRLLQGAERVLAAKQLELVQFDESTARDLQRKRQEIRDIEDRGSQYQATVAPAVAVPGKMGGRDGKIILSLSAFFGLMLGIFGAFIAEFHQRAMAVYRQRVKQVDENQFISNKNKN